MARGHGVGDGPGGLDAAHLRHADVHEDDVGGGLLGLGHGVLAVLGLGDDLDALFRLEHHDQPAPEERVVVADEHPDACRGRPSATPPTSDMAGDGTRTG